MKSSDQIIKEFCVTEKATRLSSELNQYVFEVYPEANRTEIAKAIESNFGVTVTGVRVLHRKGKVKGRQRMHRGKPGRRASKKRAIVSLKEGDKIELL